MGPAEETRHLWIGNEQAVVSPPWSMHSGVRTANYTFIWGMAAGLGSAGAKLIINGNFSYEKLDNAVNEYRAKGFQVFGYKFNVTDKDQVSAAVEQIEKDQVPIDIQINNAGVFKRTPLLEMSLADFEEVIKIDLTGVFTLARPVARKMV